MSAIDLEAYLFFSGTCREAMEFYRDVFGGELYVSTFGESPGHDDDATRDLVMHARLSGGAIDLMASDAPTKTLGTGTVELSLGGTDERQMRTVFDALAEGGSVRLPLAKQFWGDTFGTLTDRFGIDWMMNIGKPEQ
jgi:PhnB protein